MSKEHDPQINMFKLLSNEAVADNVKNSILSTEEVGLSAYRRFVEERLNGNDNLWTKLTKVKRLTWSSSAKDIRLKAGCEVLTLKATSSLFARMLVIARSAREDID